MVKKYCVGLTEEELEELGAVVSKGRAAAYKQTRPTRAFCCSAMKIKSAGR